MVRELRRCGEKTHAKAARIVKTQLQVWSELKNQMIVRRIVGHGWPHPQATGHAEVYDQYPVGMQA